MSGYFAVANKSATSWQLPHLQENVSNVFCAIQSNYPESDGEDEGTGYNAAERLVTGDVTTIGFNGVVERTVRHKEQNK